MTNAPPTPARKFAGFFNALFLALETRRICGLLAMPLKILIDGRLQAIVQRVNRLIASLRDGTYRPRRPPVTRRKPAARAPRPPGPLPRGKAWLVPHLTEAAPWRGRLGNLLQDPDIVALLATAPQAMHRSLRSLCWMLSVRPPPIIAAPRRPRRPANPPAQTPATKPARAPKAPRPLPDNPLFPASRRPSAKWPRGIRAPPKTA